MTRAMPIMLSAVCISLTVKLPKKSGLIHNGVMLPSSEKDPQDSERKLTDSGSAKKVEPLFVGGNLPVQKSDFAGTVKAAAGSCDVRFAPASRR